MVVYIEPPWRLTGYSAISGVAHAIHVTGFLSGVVLAIILVKLKLVKKADDKEWFHELWQ